MKRFIDMEQLPLSMFCVYQHGLCSVSYTANEYSIYHFCIMIKGFSISFSRVIIVQDFEAMFTLYRIGFCSVSKVAPVQCEQELMFCCGAEIVPRRSQCEQKSYPLCNFQCSLSILER